MEYDLDVIGLRVSKMTSWMVCSISQCMQHFFCSQSFRAKTFPAIFLSHELQRVAEHILVHEGTRRRKQTAHQKYHF
jgi:hypothetical protein